MKIQARRKEMANLKLSVPVDGVVTVGPDGILEVSDRCATVLLTNPKDWGKVAKSPAKQGKKTKKDDGTGDSGSDDGNASKDGSEDSQPTVAEVVEAIKAMSREELVEFANAEGYPEKIYSKLNEPGKEKAFAAWVTKMYTDAHKDE